MNRLKRIIIYPKDIQLITGKKEKSSRLLYEKIKRALKKPESGLVTIDEFCAYTGLEKSIVTDFIID